MLFHLHYNCPGNYIVPNVLQYVRSQVIHDTPYSSFYHLTRLLPPLSSSLWRHIIFFIHWFPNWSGSASVALIQKV